MKADTVTKHSFLSLPSIQAGESLYTHFVKNLTVSQGNIIKFSQTTDEHHACQKRFLGNTALSISQFCPLREIKIAPVTQSLRWGQGQIFLIHAKKDAVIHLTCAYTVTRSINLLMDFSLFLIHDSCAITIIYGTQGSRYSRPAVETSEELPFTFFHVLQYNLLTSQTKSQQVDVWRYTISIVISLLVGLLIIVSLASWYCIRKYRLQINFPGDHPGDHSRQLSPHPDPNTREHSAEVENQETTFQGKERVFTTSLMTALRKVPSRDETYGFVTKTNQYIPQGHRLDLTCKAPIIRRPSAPYLDDSNPFCGREFDQPYCLRDHNEPFCLHDVMGSNKFATVRKAKL